MWLSSIEDNVPFYESHGFGVVDKLELGKDNPTWHKEPVVVALVSLMGIMSKIQLGLILLTER